MVPVAAIPAAVASAEVAPAVTCVISGSTAAPCGMKRLTASARDARLACGALMTIAFSEGMPSERATLPETTASMPWMPTVPNPPTGRFSRLAPVTWTTPPTGSPSSLPIVYETAMAPLATLCHS